MTQAFGAEFWDQRYSTPDFVFGIAPNDFLRANAGHIPAGPVLCLAEGEGRNAVFLAERGHAVTAMDLSAAGLAKARTLSAKRGTTLTTEVADLSTYEIAAGAWSGIVAIFMHLPPALRRVVLSRVVSGLRPGGVFVMEAYNPAQLAYNTGGPKDQALLPTLAQLREELRGLEIIHGSELERDVHEGGGHTGRSAVVQVLARQPGLNT